MSLKPRTLFRRLSLKKIGGALGWSIGRYPGSIVLVWSILAFLNICWTSRHVL